MKHFINAEMELILHLTKKVFSNKIQDISFHIFKSYEMNDHIEIKFNDRILSINHNTKWIEFKKRIEKINIDNTEECVICYEIMNNDINDEYKLKRAVSCLVCQARWCKECYIKIFKNNRGLIICPLCRNQYGIRMNEREIELGIIEILNK